MLSVFINESHRWAAMLSSLALLSFVWRASRCCVVSNVPTDVTSVLNQLREGFAFLDSYGRITFANESFSSLVGRSKSSLIGLPLNDLPWLHATLSERPWANLNASASGKDTADAVMRMGDEQLIAYDHPDGRHRLLSITTNPVRLTPDSEPILVVSARDATGVEQYRAEMEHLLARVRVSRAEMEQRHAELQELVNEDALTGCQNRRALADRGAELWRRHQSQREALACLMFDIDHFKSFNDTHGHAAGDAVLSQIATILRDTFAGVGHVFRYGGEEFCVLLPRHDLAEAGWIAERVRAVIEQSSIELEKQSVRPTVSVGVADCCQGAETIDALIGQADKCLYVAKRRGRNQIVRYDSVVAGTAIRQSDRSGGSVRGDR